MHSSDLLQCMLASAKLIGHSMTAHYLCRTGMKHGSTCISIWCRTCGRGRRSLFRCSPCTSEQRIEANPPLSVKQELHILHLHHPSPGKHSLLFAAEALNFSRFALRFNRLCHCICHNTHGAKSAKSTLSAIPLLINKNRLTRAQHITCSRKPFATLRWTGQLKLKLAT